MSRLRVTGVLISSVVASSLLLSAVPANAAEETPYPAPVGAEPAPGEDESVASAPTTEDSADSLPSEPARSATSVSSDRIDQGDRIVEETSGSETGSSEAPSSADAEDSAIPSAPTSAVEPIAPLPSPTSATHVQPSTAMESGAASDPAANPSDSSTSDFSFGFTDSDLTKEQKEILEKIDALEPKGSVDWDEEGWDAFYETPEGKAYDELWTELMKSMPEWEAEASEEEDAFWEMIDEMLPEGTDEWTEEQWEAFYETPEGKEIDSLINEFEVEHGDDWGIEISPEELEFFDGLEKRMPQDSENWTEEQWDDYLSSDAGRDLLEFYLTYEFDHAQSPEELARLIEIYGNFFDDGSGWYGTFIDVYLNGPGVGVTDPSSESAAPPVPAKPSQPAASEKPKKSVGIAPAAKVIKVASERAQKANHPLAKNEQVGNELAETGFSAGWMAAGGVLVALFGIVLARRARKEPARH